MPTHNYNDYKDETLSKSVLAKCIKKAYTGLYKAHEYAHTLDKPVLTGKLLALTGASEYDTVIRKVVGTYMILCKLADFESPIPHILKPVEADDIRLFNQTRIVIAHSCEMPSDEILRLKLLIRDWQRIQT
jgi:hypothetical protein